MSDGAEAGAGDACDRSLTAPPGRACDWSHSFWMNGRARAIDRVKNSQQPDILCFVSGHYGLAIDFSDLRRVYFGVSPLPFSYTDVLDDAWDATLSGIVKRTKLKLTLHMDQDVYCLRTCASGRPRKYKDHMTFCRLWETGRVVQHYDIQKLIWVNCNKTEEGDDALDEWHFVVDDAEVDYDVDEDDEGSVYSGESSLDVLVWPHCLSLTCNIQPPADRNGVWPPNTTLTMQLGDKYSVAQTLDTLTPTASLTLECQIDTNRNSSAVPRLDDVSVNLQSAFPSQRTNQTFDVKTNGAALVGTVDKLRRPFPIGYTDIRDYDEFELRIRVVPNEIYSHASTCYVPFMLYLAQLANPTGVVSLLCDGDDFAPTGVPVQSNKDWHYKQYLKVFAMVPVPSDGTTITYRLRIIYGFYGTLPSASHINLGLVGYNSATSRWEQMAIGCWGETFCLDVDWGCVGQSICDVRALMVRKGADGKKWGWTDAGWGGDWLSVLSPEEGNLKLPPNRLRVAYMSHGPCLTEAVYSGRHTALYTNDGNDSYISYRVIVRTLRTDDHARTFHTIHYGFSCAGPSRCMYLFSMGASPGLTTPTIAWGNAQGLLEERIVPENLPSQQRYIAPFTLTGDAPWWVAFPGMHWTSDIESNSFGRAWRGLIIRSFEANLGGVVYSRPALSFVVAKRSYAEPNLNVQLVLPPEAPESSPEVSFGDGDFVKMDVEWITIPRHAVDYYGPNDAFRKQLENDNPSTWRTALREAIGNNLIVNVVQGGGEVVSNYPIIVRVDATKDETQQYEFIGNCDEGGDDDLVVKVDIVGGLGYVPIRFEKLPNNRYRLLEVQEETHEEVPLDQNVHQNDFWQTDYDSVLESFSITFNLDLGGKNQSSWVLRQL